MIFLYLLAALALPNFRSEAVIDLRANYFKHKAWFFGCFVLLLLDSLFKTWIIEGGLPRTVDLIFHLTLLTMALIAATTESDRYHKANLCLGFALVVTYIAVLFTTMR